MLCSIISVFFFWVFLFEGEWTNLTAFKHKQKEAREKKLKSRRNKIFDVLRLVFEESEKYTLFRSACSIFSCGITKTIRSWAFESNPICVCIWLISALDFHLNIELIMTSLEDSFFSAVRLHGRIIIEEIFRSARRSLTQKSVRKSDFRWWILSRQVFLSAFCFDESLMRNCNQMWVDFVV